MTRLVLTAFDPFGDDTINPTERILERFERPDLELHKIIVPTSFRAVRGKVLEALALQPDIVLSMGQAGGRRGLSLERVAINIMDARIPDNAGAKPTDQAIVPSGPAAYFTTSPQGSSSQKLKQAGIDASLSSSAGTFVCNALFYEFLHQTAQSKTGCAFCMSRICQNKWKEKT